MDRSSERFPLVENPNAIVGNKVVDRVATTVGHGIEVIRWQDWVETLKAYTDSEMKPALKASSMINFYLMHMENLGTLRRGTISPAVPWDTGTTSHQDIDRWVDLWMSAKETRETKARL